MTRYERCMPPTWSTMLRRIRAMAALGLFVLSLLAVFGGGDIAAQSGRRAPKSNTPLPPPAETPAPGSASTTGTTAKQPPKPSLKLAVFEFDNPLINTYLEASIIARGFLDRLKDAPGVSATGGGKITRKEAAARAKNETEAHVVVLQLEESSAIGGRESIGQIDPATLVVKYYVYAPTSGTLLYVGRIEQRPYQPTARVGGIRIPVPTPVPRGRRVSDLTLEQAARDTAERVLARFFIRLPPER